MLAALRCVSSLVTACSTLLVTTCSTSLAVARSMLLIVACSTSLTAAHRLSLATCYPACALGACHYTSCLYLRWSLSPFDYC
ncbi:unnamed protein product [Sphenostylis stenocarpa]|uniref:Uncharacterized protein n=1 Tax=Sphenostylis stenocarpa TaxID=92480 RepID=A0AA86RSG2_9FABA|nr:unnamed protein product [Sphenostylis stenocarpa]